MIRVAAGDKPSSLERYRHKRDPGQTTEPFSPEPLASGPTWSGRFVVHEHDATRRHFDLRIEVAGALKSFAVPRGPSLDPEEKRLAIETEDHPLVYVDYEGVIPEENYGAGAMIAWDLGRVRYLEQDAESGIAKGKIDFELYGVKLRGRFALVRTSGRSGRAREKQPQWLLIKKRDGFERADSAITDEQPESVLSGLRVAELEHAGERLRELEQRALALGAVRAELRAKQLTPMACGSHSGKLQDPRAIYELKLDGVRILADKRGDDVALYYRKGLLATISFPDVVRAVRALPVERVLLDGEIVAFDPTGKPNFQRLAQRFSARRPRDVERAEREVAVSYVTFDILALSDLDLTKLPLLARKELLQGVVPRRGLIRWLDHLTGDGEPLFAFCRQQGLEGVIVKRADGPYRFGPKASSDWAKIKCEREDDFVVIGYTRGNGTRTLGALDLASYEGDTLVSRGGVGTGWDEATAALLERELASRHGPRSAFTGEPPRAPNGRTFVRPELVVNVRYQGFTPDGQLRHAVYHGLRADVDPRACTAHPHADAEQLVASEEGTSSELPDSAPVSAPARRAKLTNPAKVFWPNDGYTKRDLWNYYEAVAPVLLPFLKERPVILVRYPDGIDGKSFYQWNAPRGTPSWVRTVRVSWEGRGGKEVDLFLIDDLDTLLHIANLGCIPLHILAARVGALAFADFLTIDFDLGGQPLAHAITLARALHELLGQLGLAGFPKTSGQTGLHVLVPLGPGISFDTSKALAELLGRLIHATHPDLSTVERVKERRGPRVYVDTGQTGTLRAIVAPYSLRAYPGARVSTPLTWDEVGFALDPARFTLSTVPERVAQVGDPMAGFLEQRPDVHSAVQKLGERLGR